MTGDTTKQVKMQVLELTENEVLLFNEFVKFHRNFLILRESGALNLRNGSATLQFDKDGNIGVIDIHTIFRLQHFKPSGTVA